MVWPPQSFDLNPIEQTTLKDISYETFSKYILTMRPRCQVIEVKYQI
jgi:hypothetical protein